MIVSPKLFGYNLECTRRVGYGGLYAEMLQNGKFHAGTQAFYPVSFDGMEGWGQYTERLQVTTGQTYDLTAIGGETVHIRLMTEFGTELFSCQSSHAQFTSRFTLQNIRFEAVSSDNLRYVSMRPADAFHGCRRDVLDALKALRPGFLRVPGGCFAERYVWKDGLLPIGDRPVITDGGNHILFSSSFGQDTYELNIDDYAAICRYVGAEMAFTVRLSDNDPQDAADLVEYCNGDLSTPYGALRAARGYLEPYNVKTWYIGNELAYLSTSVLSDASHACTVNDQFVEAMRKVDPSIRTVVSTGNFSDWDTAFVKAARQIDLCSHHYYLLDTHPEADLALALRAANEITLPRLEHASSCIGHKRMCFDEWNLRWGAWGSAVSALYAAGVTIMVLRNAERLNIDCASYFAPVNEGAIRVYPDMVRLAPDGEILKRMALHANGTLCDTADECSVETKHDGWRYYSVYNPSADNEKSVLPMKGEYELLIPLGDQLDITSGEGVLDKLPPAAVAFIRIKD